jgi:WD40 repeat protein
MISLEENSTRTLVDDMITDIVVMNNENILFLTQMGKLYNYNQNNLSLFHSVHDDFITSFDIIPCGKESFSLVAIGTEAGDFYLINNSGNIQKTIKEAHKGSVINVKFSKDFQTITTSGEDSVVKLWSKLGMLRSEIYKADSPIYSLEWSSDSQIILLGGSKVITIKSIKPGNKDIICKVCDFGVALIIRWSRSEDIFFVTTEDCRFCIFDNFGRLLHQSEPFEFPFVAGDWILGSNNFVLFSNKEILVCHKNGKVKSRLLVDEIAMCLSLSENSNQFYIGLSNGKLQKGFLNIFEKITYKNINIDFQDKSKIVFSDIHSDYVEKVSLNGKEVIGVDVFNDHILILVKLQCFLYKVDNFLTPVFFETKEDPILFYRLSSNYIVLAYQTQPVYISIYDFGGKLVNNIKFPSQSINKKLLQLAYESLFVIDPANSKLAKILDPLNGKMSSKFSHQNDIMEISSNHHTEANQRKLLFFDSNKDLFIYFVYKNVVKKVASMVYSFKWHEKLDIFAYTSEQKVTIVYYPNSFILDQELYHQCLEKKAVSKNNQITFFNSTQIYLKDEQNSKTVLSINPLGVKLIEHFNNSKVPLETRISKAVKLARFLKDKLSWAILCVFCLENRDMTSAEICLGALENLEKVQFVFKINNLEDEALSQAYLFQMLNKEEEAQNLLIKENKMFEVIKMKVKNFDFSNALEIAQKCEDVLFIDYVLLNRKRYLEEIGINEESLEEFKNLRSKKTLEEVKSLLKSKR